ncbi:hypothetical protein [Helicobacter didelphidarum]|nr:hypothetical protein [Helicobacter didelphidarum]
MNGVQMFSVIMFVVVCFMPVGMIFYVKHKDKQHREKLKKKG